MHTGAFVVQRIERPTDYGEVASSNLVGGTQPTPSASVGRDALGANGLAN